MSDKNKNTENENLFRRLTGTTKRVTRQVVHGFGTDVVFQENEIKSNMFMTSVLFVNCIIMIIAEILNELNIFIVEKASMRLMTLLVLFVLVIPAILCIKYQGKKKWLKLVMLLDLTMVYAALTAALTYRVTLLMVVPVLLSSRYYSKQLTISTGLLSAIVFGFAASFGINHSYIDLNYVTLPANTTLIVSGRIQSAVQSLGLNMKAQEANILMNSYVPNFLIFLISASASTLIASAGHQMVISQACISKEHARVETELDVAKAIQERALPIVHTLHEHPEFDIAATMLPAKEVGGDFYDFLYVDPTHLALIIADVSGKGVPAALMMMVSKMLLDNSITAKTSPGQVLAEVNHQLCEKNLEDMFVTVWLGILDLETGIIVEANGGHEYPIVQHKGGKFEICKDKHGLVLGGMDGVRYRESQIQLNPGDTLFVYTDGVPEATNSSLEQYGMNRTLSALDRIGTESMSALVRGLKEDIDAFAGDEPQFDDTTMLALRLNFLKSSEGISVKPDKESTAAVASYIETRMEEAEVGMREISKINIAVDELYSNIVQYSGATWAEAVCKINDASITVILRDNGIPYNPLMVNEPDTKLSAEERIEGGLGIFMTRKLMSDIQYTHASGRNEVTIILNR